jgi:hypothetical protein
MNGEYGLLAGLVGSVAALLSAGAAITAAWVRTANWAPPEDGVPSAPTKVCALLTAVAVAGLWFETGKSLSSRDLEIIAGSAGGLTFLFLLIYTALIMVYVYQKQLPDLSWVRTTGGFWLTKTARQKLHLPEVSGDKQKLLHGAAYNSDLVWPRFARGLVMICFIVGFVGITFCGSVAISSIALSIDPSASKVPDKIR